MSKDLILLLEVAEVRMYLEEREGYTVIATGENMEKRFLGVSLEDTISRALVWTQTAPDFIPQYL